MRATAACTADLDSGYLSRILRALEADGLISVEIHETDARVRTARLTSAGLRERAELNRRADKLALSILDQLTPDQRDRLVLAMAEVERLLVADDGRYLPWSTLAEPRARILRQSVLRPSSAECFDVGFDPARAIPADDASN